MRRIALVTLMLFVASAAHAADPSSAVEATTAFTKLISKESKSKPATAVPVAEPEKPRAESKKRPGIVFPSMTKEEQKAEGKVKSVKGMVSGVNNFGLAVEYDKAREMWADLMKETKLEGVQSLKDLRYGDQVELTYKELKSNSKRLLLKARLIRRAPQERQNDDELKATE